MTYQGGPDMPRDPYVPRDPNVQRDDGNWNVVAGAIALAFILGLGFMLFAGERTSTDKSSYRATERIEKPDTPARPAPTPPAPSKQP
jgi:hypothetical protein